MDELVRQILNSDGWIFIDESIMGRMLGSRYADYTSRTDFGAVFKGTLQKDTDYVEWTSRADILEHCGIDINVGNNGRRRYFGITRRGLLSWLIARGTNKHALNAFIDAYEARLFF